MRAPLFLISLALSSTACSDVAEERATAPSPAAKASAVASASAEAQAESFEDQEERGGGTREFAYSWPPEVGEQPVLEASLTEERDAALAAQKDEWLQSLDEFPEDCASCKSRGYEKEWQVVAELERWLSLSARIYEYTGGAHGNYTRQSLIWDKERGTAMAGIDLFKSPVALETALGASLCDALDEERAKRRGAPVERSGEWSTDCPGLDEASVFVGSSDGEHFNRIGVYFGPYVAGAYAEGEYELNFPVTASVLDAVRPEYARAFRVKR